MIVESLKNNIIISKSECFFVNLKMYGFFNGLYKIHFYLHTCTHMYVNKEHYIDKNKSTSKKSLSCFRMQISLPMTSRNNIVYMYLHVLVLLSTCKLGFRAKSEKNKCFPRDHVKAMFDHNQKVGTARKEEETNNI